MGFCWLCSGGFLLVIGIRFMGLVVLNGVVVGLAVGVTVGLVVGCRCHRRCGHGPWVMVMVLGFFFCLGCWVVMVV